MADLPLSGPMRWRFTDDEDIAAYGDRWWTWDPIAHTRLRARDLIAIEEAISMPYITLIDQIHNRTTFGQLAALWVSMHVAGHPVDFDDFNPLVFTTEWEVTPAESPLDSGEDPPTDSPSSPAPSTESATS